MGPIKKRIKYLKTIFRLQRKRRIFIRKWQSMKKIVLLIALVSLSGCAETVYRTDLEIYCPPIENYSEDFSETLAVELDVLDEAYEAIPEVVTDYILLRDRIRQCNAEKEEL